MRRQAPGTGLTARLMDEETGTWEGPSQAEAQLCSSTRFLPGSGRWAVGAVAFLYSPCGVEPSSVGRPGAGESGGAGRAPGLLCVAP